MAYYAEPWTNNHKLIILKKNKFKLLNLIKLHLIVDYVPINIKIFEQYMELNYGIEVMIVPENENPITMVHQLLIIDFENHLSIQLMTI